MSATSPWLYITDDDEADAGFAWNQAAARFYEFEAMAQLDEDGEDYWATLSREMEVEMDRIRRSMPWHWDPADYAPRAA